MKNKERYLKVLGWTVFAFSASAFFLPVMNPDIFWHLSAGKYAAANFSPPRFDFLSWTSPGGEWVDPEWGAQVIFYLAHKAGGFKALLVLKAAILCLALLVFRGLALLYGAAALLPLALPLLAAGLVGGGDLGPENFSLLFFAFTLYRLEQVRLGHFRPGRLSWPALLPLFAVWANIHPGFVYGLALAGLYAAGEFFSERLPAVHGGRAAGTGRSAEYLKLFLAGLAATLANPYGWKLYKAIAGRGLFAAGAGEYMPGWAASGLGNPLHWPYLLALAGLSALAAAFMLRRRHAVYPHLAALLFFAWASAAHNNLVPFFMLYGLAFALALPWGGQPAFLRGERARGAAACWLLVCLWFYSAYVWPQHDGSASFFRASSDNLARFLRTNKAELSGLRLYNHSAWGGWLGWELAPDYKIFLDDRALFRERRAELAEARAAIGTWCGLIEKYRFDLMLVALNEPLVPVKQRLAGGREEVFWRPAYLFYLPKNEWAVVYWDYKVAALVRRSAVPAAWLAAREYFYLRPADVPNLSLPVLAGQVPLSGLERELGLFLDSHPGGERAPANTALVNFCERIKKDCAKKGAKCLL
ncbi:MAG: hypothetical protein HY550_08030 [Elusimicrobia bacterium]|nr:hypothetical protein [Elusimicrobiota bacterium]